MTVRQELRAEVELVAANYAADLLNMTPEQRLQLRGEPYCENESDDGWICTRTEGHTGPHAAIDGFGTFYRQPHPLIWK